MTPPTELSEPVIGHDAVISYLRSEAEICVSEAQRYSDRAQHMSPTQEAFEMNMESASACSFKGKVFIKALEMIQARSEVAA